MECVLEDALVQDSREENQFMKDLLPLQLDRDGQSRKTLVDHCEDVESGACDPGGEQAPRNN